MPKAVSYFPEEEEGESKLWRKMKEDITFPVGIAAFTGTVLYGLWGIRTRKIPISLYLMHLRVASQGLCIGILALGMSWQLGKRVYNMYEKAEPESSSHSS